jgi:superfamily I DNA/RNA helicase/RecB family exonuclease
LLRERFARLVEAGAPPEKVALLVLNRRAARDAREVLTTRLARSLPDLPVFTAHGFAFRVLGRRFEDAGYREPPHVLSAPEQYAAVRRMLLGERAEDWPSFGHLLGVRGFAQQVADFVLRAQERLLEPDQVDRLVDRSRLEEYREVARFYRRYLDELSRTGQVDFAGLLFRTASLLERDLSADETFGHLLLDDYQDATHATEAILSVLAPAATSVVVAADPPGHVFGFQGGTVEPLSRLGDTLGGLSEVRLAESRRLGGLGAVLPALDESSAPPVPAGTGFQAHRFAHPGEEADAVAHELVRLRVDDDVPWEKMAVILRRYGEYLTALRHALQRHGIPFIVVAEAAAVATEPANRPVIDLLRYVFREAERDDLLDRLLVTPLCGLDPHALRRLRREARRHDVTLRELVEGTAEDAVIPGDLEGPVSRFRTLVHEVPAKAEELGPDGLFFWLWSSQPYFRDLVASTDGSRDLDALSALGDVLSGFVERRPGATVQDYLDTLDAAEFGPDPWIPPEERYPHAVRIVSAHRAHGMEFEVVLVVGCLEGEFPSLGHAYPLVDLEEMVAPRTPVERLRHRLAEERALFRLAVSRARRRTILTASHSTSARNPRTPSRFAERIGLEWTPAPDSVPPAASLRTMEASLRRRLADPNAPRADRLSALAALPSVGADPKAWWGGRDWTDPGMPLHGEDLRTSYSRFGVLENCALQYLYQVEMGLDPAQSHAMWLGTVIHDLIDKVQRGELPREEDALLRALDDVWDPEVFPNRALERQRYLDARKMVRLWLEDPGYGDVLASELGFEFRLDGAEVHGRIDAVFRMGEGGVRVVDYKTGRYPPTGEDVRHSLQLAAYFLAMRRVPELAELGEPRLLELAFPFLESGEGGYKHYPVKPDRVFDTVSEYERWAETTILGLLDEVRAERFAPSPEAECRFCSFKPICPVWPQGAEVAT